MVFLRIDAQGRLLEIGNRATSLDGIQGQYMGLLKFTRRGWRQMEELLHLLTPTMIDNLSMTGLLERAISHGLAIYGVAIQEGWLEVDSPSDLSIDSYNPQ